MSTSEVAKAGMPLTLKLTGINAEVLTVNGAGADVPTPFTTATTPVPPGSAGTIAVICPSLQLVVVADKVVESTVMLTVPAVAPNPAPVMDTVAPGFATRGVTVPIEGDPPLAETQIDTLRWGRMKFATALLPPIEPVTTISVPPIVRDR
jgi:hypothetical protein